MLINGLKSSKTMIFLKGNVVLLSYMDLTQHLQSTEFPMFYSSKSGSGGVENISPSLSILRTLSITIKPL